MIGSGTGGELIGGISLDDATGILTINVGWGADNGFTNLTGITTNQHILLTTTNSMLRLVYIPIVDCQCELKVLNR